jgi:hypothetical protein
LAFVDKSSDPKLLDDGDRIAQLEARLDEYRRTDLDRWADAAIEAERGAEQLNEIHQTLSWRITAPLRSFRRRSLSS